AAIMGFPASRDYTRIVLVGVLVVVLVALAVMQYHWSLAVSRAERTRIEASLNASVSQFRQEFYRELSQAAATFHTDPEGPAGEFWSAYGEQYQAWMRTAQRPDLIANLYVWPVGTPDFKLLRLRAADGRFETADWPTELSGLRGFMEQESRHIL